MQKKEPSRVKNGNGTWNKSSKWVKKITAMEITKRKLRAIMQNERKKTHKTIKKNWKIKL